MMIFITFVVKVLVDADQITWLKKRRFTLSTLRG